MGLEDHVEVMSLDEWNQWCIETSTKAVPKKLEGFREFPKRHTSMKKTKSSGMKSLIKTGGRWIFEKIDEGMDEFRNKPILVGAYTDRIRLLEHTLPILLYLHELAGYDG